MKDDLLRSIRYRFHRWKIKRGMIFDLPTDWQGKLSLATELGVSVSSLPFSGANETILLAKNGFALDERIREELDRRRQRASHGARLLWLVWRILRNVFWPTPSW
jgi:hypothetical protein